MTAPAAQALLGATLLPKTQIIGETNTVLEIARESWLAKEEVIHMQMVDVELDLTLGHPEDPHEVTHVQMVDAVLDLTWGHSDNTVTVAHAQLASKELNLTEGHLENAVKVAHMQLVSVELNPLLGNQDDLEDKAHAQMVDAEPGPTLGYPEDPSVDAHAQFVSMEPNPPLGDPHEDTCAHPECTELEVLMDMKDDLLHEVKEVEEETTGVTTAVDKECVDLQGLGVSHLTMLEGANTLTFPSTLLRTASLPRSPVTGTGMWATRELRPGANTDPPPLDLPPPKEVAEPLGSRMPEQIQAPAEVERPLELLWGKKSQCATGQDSQVSVHILEGRTPLGMAHGCPPNPADLHMQGSTILE